jgi:hypothetical protein
LPPFEEEVETEEMFRDDGRVFIEALEEDAADRARTPEK